MIIKAKVLNLRREKNSRYGNPKYSFILQNVLNGNAFWAQTRTNASCAYTVTTQLKNKEVMFQGTYYKNGEFVIDDIIELASEEDNDNED